MDIKKLFSVFFAITFLVLAFGSISCQAQLGEDTKPAPGFTLTDLNDQPYSLANAAGKVVILDFWATWCPPCRKGIPEFQSLYTEYKGKGLVVIGIALDRGGASDVKPFVKSNGVTYPIVIGNQQVVNSYGGIRGIPTTFIIDRKGNIVQKYVGYRSKKVFENDIKKLL